MARRGKAKATFTVEPGLRRKLARSEGVRDLLYRTGADLAGTMDDITRRDVAASRAGRMGFGQDAILTGTWVKKAKAGKAKGDGGYKSTGRLASSWSFRVQLTKDGWVLMLGSGAGVGTGEVEYAAVYLWGYDPTGPRGHYQWGGNDVFEKAFAQHRIAYKAPYR